MGVMDNVIEIQGEKTVPVGYKHTEIGIIPEDWDVSPLAKHTLFVGSGKTNTKSKGDFPLFGSTGQIGSCLNPEYDGDAILIARVGANAGKLSFVSGQYGVSDNTIIVKLKPKNNIHFFKYWLTSQNLNSLVFGSGQPLITGTQLKELSLPAPSINEQTAIANVLSDTDVLITELEKLIAKKQAIKTATMQQLLTGRTRLPQFAKRPDGTLKSYKFSELGRLPEDWEVHPLGYLLNDSPRYGINAPAVKLAGNIPVYIRITDISDNGYFRPTEKVGVNSLLSDFYILQEGDIVLARTGASVGKSYLYKPEDGPLVYAGFLIKITPDQKSLNSKFLFQFLKTQQYWNWIATNSMRSGQPGVNGNEFASLPLPVPPKKEQTAIATILSDMDAELDVLEQKLSKVRDIKQGMMQQLLTGRIRLPLDQQS